jgi:ATP-dependent Clp protease ATP-binding subunit ClpC
MLRSIARASPVVDVRARDRRPPSGELVRAAGRNLAIPSGPCDPRGVNRPALALAERSASELAALRKLASELAHARKERATSVHLLAAIADRPGAAADLLRERRLDRDEILKAGRSFDEDGPDAIGRALSEAREVQKRVRTPLPTDRPRAAQLSPDARHVLTEPSQLHLLIALLGERRFAACRALAHFGVDLARLRAAAMQHALGLVAARRPAARVASVPTASPTGAPPPRPAGVTVPLVPPSTLGSPAARARSPRPASAPPPRPAAAKPPPRAESPPRPAVPSPPAEVLAEAPPASARVPVGPARTALDPARFPLLAAVGRDLVLEAERGELPPVVGRDAEVDRVLDVLGKLRANVPLLVGPPGVGKTSVAHGLAHRYARAPGNRRRLVEIGVPELVAGTGTRGALAERIAQVRVEVARSEGEIVLFVDEVHELFAGGVADEAAGELRAALSRGELPMVGASTTEQLRKAIDADPALARRVVPIELEEPDPEDAFLQIQAACARLAKHHGLEVEDEAIAAAVGWSVRYLPGRALPDKALALLDLAGARRARVLAADPRGRGAAPRALRAVDVAPIVAEAASIPEERLLESDQARMLGLERALAERVVGRDEALGRIATLLRRNAVGLRGERPIGTFLLLGPTGVGKTETAKAIAEALFDAPDAMTRLDLSEFAESHAIARLVGAPPGYVGHEAGGQLTEAVRKRPYQVVLLDEIEKAHRDVLQAFLQVFDEGRLTDGRGRRVDFTNTVIVLTSNLGADEMRRARDRRGIGFAGGGAPGAPAMHDAALAAARKALPPELYNRIDEVVFYAPLARDEVAAIARKLLAEVGARLADRGVSLQVEDEAVEALLDGGGWDPDLGARPMRRAIARLVEAPIAELILRGDAAAGSTILLGRDGDRPSVDVVPPPARR